LCSPPSKRCTQAGMVSLVPEDAVALLGSVWGTRRALPAAPGKHRACRRPLPTGFLLPAYLSVQAAEPLGRQCPSLPAPCPLLPAPCPSLTIAARCCLLPASSACSLPIPTCLSLTIAACSPLITAHPCLRAPHGCLFPARPCLLPTR